MFSPSTPRAAALPAFSLKNSLKWFKEYETYQDQLPRPDIFLESCAPLLLRTTLEEARDWHTVVDLCIRQIDVERMTPILAEVMCSILEKLQSLHVGLDTEINDYVLYMISKAALSTSDNQLYLSLLKQPYWQADYGLIESEKITGHSKGYLTANASSFFNIGHTDSMIAHHSHIETDVDRSGHVIVRLDAPGRFDFSSLRVEDSAKLTRHDPLKHNYERFIAAIHDSTYLRRLRDYSSLSWQVGLRLPLDKHGDTMMSPHTFNAAIESACMTMAMVSKSYKKKKPAIVMARPPGHHAGRDFGEGFCLINNITCAAMLLIKELGVQRILILDIDAHKGNGTHDIVCHHPLFKKHVVFQDYYNDQIYQGCSEDHMEESDVEQPAHVHQKVLPSHLSVEKQKEIIQHMALRIEKTKADFVLISFGLDGHKSDPIGGETGYTDEFFTELVRMLYEKTEGKCTFVVEGGYNQTVNMRIINKCIELLDPAQSAYFLSPA